MTAEQMMVRIREVEQTQTIAELKQKVSSLEVKNQELLTAGQLRGGTESEEVKDLQDRISDMQAEVLRLETMNKKLTSAMAVQNIRRGDASRNGSISDGFSRSNSINDDLASEQMTLESVLRQLDGGKTLVNGEA